MDFAPLGNGVVILPDDEEPVTDGGIILPEKSKEIPTSGKVVAVGPGRWVATGVGPKRIPMDVEVGHHVLYKQYVGGTVEVEGVEYKMMTEDDIVAIDRSK